VSSKGIAIQTILLLLLGTLTVGILVYATYRSTTGSPLGEYECRGLMVSWCAGCARVGWTGGSGMSDKLKDCAQKHWGFSHNDCNAQNDCAGFVPIVGGGGSVTTTPTTTTVPTGPTCAGAGGFCVPTAGTCRSVCGVGMPWDCDYTYPDCSTCCCTC